jgi:hypothetical protein
VRRLGAEPARVLCTRRRDVPITVIRLLSTQHVPQSPEEIHTVLQFFQRFLDVFNDVVVTDGWLDQLIGLAPAGTGGEAERVSVEAMPGALPSPPLARVAGNEVRGALRSHPLAPLRKGEIPYVRHLMGWRLLRMVGKSVWRSA